MLSTFWNGLTEAQSILLVGGAFVALLAIFWTGGAVSNAIHRYRGDPLGDHCEHCEQVETLERRVTAVEDHSNTAELENIRRRAVELRNDTDLTYPSASETAMHTAALIVLGEDK